MAPVCRAHRVDLVDARLQREPGGQVLRVIIERTGADPTAVGGGVSLEDCKQVSRDLSEALEVHEDVVPAGKYRLEVTSPGLDRPLIRLSDFERFAGHEVKLQTQRPLDGRRRFRGPLLGVSGEKVRLEQDGAEVEVPYEDITKANIVYRFE